MTNLFNAWLKKEASEEEDSGQKEVGLEYKIDTSNSIKVQIDDEDDFLGVQHKIEF